MMSLFIDSTGIVNGMGGNFVKIWGHGKLHLSLLPYSGQYSYVTEMDNSVYVPSLPLIIIPTQMNISNLKTKDNL